MSGRDAGDGSIDRRVPDPRQRIVVVCGSTATGKTALAVRLAARLHGEIINADSRQVYRWMDIGTAKPSLEQRAAVPHHLLDIVDPDEPFTLASYLDRARATVADIAGRGRLPFVVGGTGLYVRALARGFDVPRVAPDLALRAELEALGAAGGAGALYERLRHLDRTAAAVVDPRNPRRLIRAIEVAVAENGAGVRADVGDDRASRAHASGAPVDSPTAPAVGPEAAGAGLARAAIDAIPAATATLGTGYNALVLGLTADRAVLYTRADRRIDEMLAAGLRAEVAVLQDRGYAPDLPSMSALGYREMGAHLRGLYSLDEAVERTRTATHRFIRRQLTWFRREPDLRWVDITDGDGEAGVLRLIEEWLSVP